MEKPKLSIINAAKISHDIEQLLYLKRIGWSRSEDGALIDNLQILKGLIEERGRKIIEVDELIEKFIGTDYFFSKSLRREEKILHSALRKSAFDNPVVLEFKESGRKVYVFDDVLEQPALYELRSFLNEAMIWFEVKENFNYLFTDARYGLKSNLLTLIQNEMRANLQPFFGAKQLLEFWAIKYDLTESGIPMHADQRKGCFTSNLWVTPETSNLDPSRGGMTVLDLAPPPDWPWPVAITQKERIAEYIRQNPSQELLIPYKGNRIILFPSELFHKTNDVCFGPGYEDRRVSLTHIYKS